MNYIKANWFPIIIFIGALGILGCNYKSLKIADQMAGQAAKSLHKRMVRLADKGVMVGHQDALAYGIGWWNQKNSADMFRVSGEFPAIYGWDLGDIHLQRNLDSVAFDDMRQWMLGVHENGGINTISFHVDNPIDGNSSWDTSKIAGRLLPGGLHHKKLNHQLDLVAEFLKSLKDKSGQPVPVIFRPWHEHNGDWFWWGKGNATEEEYIALFRHTVDYFKKQHHIHHILYAFSPDRSRMKNPSSEEEYLYGYPGDDVVDLLGIDNYKDVRAYHNDSLDQKGISDMVKNLEMLSALAQKKGKLCAMTETGTETINDAFWFTKRILEPIRNSNQIEGLSYVLFWRNARTNHHYLSYPGHPSAKDFKEFITDPTILTLKDIGTNFSH
ncbi:MAG: beta-mannosidase [Saprospiraceae bacterium]|nr:beta-mannosidase [Saprospiraceae bacterium]